MRGFSMAKNSGKYAYQSPHSAVVVKISASERNSGRVAEFKGGSRNAVSIELNL